MPSNELTDDDVLAAVRTRAGTGVMTYVLRNILGGFSNEPGYRPGLRTDEVRRRLQRLERMGRVRRVPSSYVREICWAPVDTDPE